MPTTRTGGSVSAQSAPPTIVASTPGATSVISSVVMDAARYLNRNDQYGYVSIPPNMRPGEVIHIRRPPTVTIRSYRANDPICPRFQEIEEAFFDHTLSEEDVTRGRVAVMAPHPSSTYISIGASDITYEYIEPGDVLGLFRWCLAHPHHELRELGRVALPDRYGYGIRVEATCSWRDALAHVLPKVELPRLSLGFEVSTDETRDFMSGVFENAEKTANASFIESIKDILIGQSPKRRRFNPCSRIGRAIGHSLSCFGLPLPLPFSLRLPLPPPITRELLDNIERRLRPKNRKQRRAEAYSGREQSRLHEPWQASEGRRNNTAEQRGIENQQARFQEVQNERSIQMMRNHMARQMLNSLATLPSLPQF